MAKDTKAEDDSDRAYRLVGKFMADWAFLESELNHGLEKLSGLPVLEGLVITANMQVRDKIHTLQALLNLFHPDIEGAGVNSLMKKVGNMSGDRNTVAHTMFFPHEKGVKFSVRRAKGKLATNSVVWHAKQFAEKSARMRELSAELRRAVRAANGLRSKWILDQADKRLAPQNPFRISGGIFGQGRNAFIPDDQPTQGLGALGLLAGLPHPLPEPQRSQTASPETRSQTPEAPPVKPKASGKRK